MAAQAIYNLVLGIETQLEKAPFDLNPSSTGHDDENNPRYIIVEEPTNWGKSYIFPDGSIVENLEHRKKINQHSSGEDLTKLVFLEDDFWLEDGGVTSQYLGISLQSHAGGGHMPGDAARIRKGLEMKSQVAEMINKYGFNVTEDDIGLHQIMNPYDD
ncbi:hypothetical protein GOV14_03045 [Candidatus Pacearchaeota archaeon]|nr:hypothetical protein [Candidatus Pacearchaeota archaeon]